LFAARQFPHRDATPAVAAGADHDGLARWDNQSRGTSLDAKPAHRHL
jgi:hypothetical protein